MASLKKRAYLGVRWSGLSTIVTGALQILQLVLLTRLLNIHEYGLIVLVLVVITIFQGFVDAGMSNALVHFQSASQSQLSSLYWLSWIFGSLACAFLILIAPGIAQLYMEPELSAIVRLAALSILIAPAGQQFQSLMQKEFRFKQIAIIEIIALSFGTIAACSTAYFGEKARSVAWGLLVSTLLRSCLLVVLGRKRWSPDWHFSMQDVRPYLVFGGYQMGERILNLLYMNIDKLLIGKILGADALGVYSVASQLMIKPFSAMSSAISRVSFPLFAQVQTDNQKIQRGYHFVISGIALVCVPIYFGMASIADPLIQFLFGDRWLGSAGVLKILAFLGILYSFGNLLGSILLAKGRADLGFWMNVYGLTMYISALYIGSFFNITGIAWALLLTTAIFVMPVDFYLRSKLVGMRASDFLRVVWPFLISGFLMSLVMWGLDHYLLAKLENAFRLTCLIACGAALYICNIMVFCRKYLNELIDLIKGK
ncbi:MOP flippase family protein [Undibacterium sp. Ji49W]|uniref:MOP flippase family protein n=1 Tax=Undibacterium sp. Ji49W TaxID=3413040 RepID=UPI003BF35B68